MENIFLVCGLVLLFCRSSVSEDGGGGRVDDCTSGFISLDRMNAVLGNYGPLDLVTVFETSVQVIIPGINFTCAGSILSWTLGAQWWGAAPALTELQIWRSSGDGSYTKVGSTTIMTEESTTGLYQYPLSSPLPFQAGDILGYFGSQLRLQFEDVGSGNLLHYNYQDSAASQFTVSDSSECDDYHVLISVETDAPGCGCGFMSVERMRILLGLDTVRDDVGRNLRQEITPDIKFTCDGMITKWIVGADWDSRSSFYPELQVWRNIGNDVYQKINGTFINIEAESSNRIYKYDNFSPIPFLAGDILGVFIPRAASSRLRLRTEKSHGPLSYHIPTEDTASESPHNIIDLQNTPEITTNVYIYHHLVTAEIVVVSSSPASSASASPSEVSSTGSLATSAPTSLLPMAASALPTQPQSVPEHGGALSVYVSVGVSVAVVVLVAVAVIAISVSVCLRKTKKSKHVNTTDNVAYHCSSDPETMTINEAYTDIIANDPNYVYVDSTYSYATQPTTAVMTSNVAYNALSCSGRNDEIKLETNDAYDPVSVAENVAYQLYQEHAYHT